MKNKLILFTLVMALILSMVSVPNTGKASAAKAETLPSYDYMILGNTTYHSTKASTLSQELAKAQKGKKANETFSDKTEKRMKDNWTKISFSADFYTGYQATSYYNPTRNEIVIAYAGTSDLMDWIDPTALFVKGQKQRKPAIAYADRMADKIGVEKYLNPKTNKSTLISSKAKIIMTGHSLGGYLTQTSGLHLLTSKKHSDKFKAGFTFNALGIGKNDVTTTQWTNNQKGKYNKFIHYSTSWEFVKELNKARGLKLAGSSKHQFVAPITNKLSNSFSNHKYKALYKYFKWE